MTDPDNLTGAQGIYSNHERAWSEKWEREATVAMYEDGGEFSLTAASACTAARAAV